MKNKLLTMLEMQDAMNSRINENWRGAGSEWYRAIWIESAEMLDHYGWKWWKHQEPDMQQVILEIVDIWHFILSDQLQDEKDPEVLVTKLLQAFSLQFQKQPLPAAIEDLALLTLQNKASDLNSFVNLLAAAEMDLDELYKGYVGKNVLNFFRQDHGYKDGSYIKLWGGREDNEHLVETIEQLDTESKTFRDDLYNGLKQKYDSLCEPTTA